MHEKMRKIFWDTPTNTMKIPTGFSLVGPAGGFCYCKIRDNESAYFPMPRAIQNFFSPADIRTLPISWRPRELPLESEFITAKLYSPGSSSNLQIRIWEGNICQERESALLAIRLKRLPATRKPRPEFSPYSFLTFFSISFSAKYLAPALAAALAITRAFLFSRFLMAMAPISWANSVSASKDAP